MVELISCCPGCGTTYKVTTVQLTVAGGRVRCGSCQVVFHAMQHVIAKQELGKQGLQRKSIPEEEELIYDEMPFESGEEAQGQEINSVGLISAPHHDAPYKPETTKPVEKVQAFKAFQVPSPGELVDIPTLQTARPETIGISWLKWTPVLLALSLALLLQYAHFRPLEVIHKAPQLQPYLEQLCAISGCNSFGYAPDFLAISQLQVATHPGQDRALKITGRLVNRAVFPQQLPRMAVIFDDINGKPMARRVFTAKEYIPDRKRAQRLFPAKSSLWFELEIIDPGKDAQSYTFQLF